MQRRGLGRLVGDERANAAIGWVFVALTVVAGVGGVVRGDLLWLAFTLVVAGIAALPAVVTRSPLSMPPWEVVVVATLPAAGRLFTTTILTGQVVTYVSVAALSLLVAVDLDVFTGVRMNDSFAALFVVVTTLAAAGVWAVVRWLSDIALGTALVADEHTLMVEFSASAVAGIIAAVAYVLYRRRSNAAERLPEGVEPW